MRKLRQIFCADWAVRRQDINGVLALITPGILAGKLEEAEKLLEAEGPKAYAVAAPYNAEAWDLDDKTLPENSVAIIRLQGFIWKWETDWLREKLAEVENNPAIAGLLLIIDGPGGDSTRIDVAAKEIRNMSKPSATLVEGDMCSALYWLGSSTDRIFALSPLCRVGSVGAMCEFTSLAKFYEKNGISIRDIYPDTSDLKNEEYKALEAGNDEITKERLARLHKIFAEAVAENLGIPYDPELEFFRGRVYDAEEALKLGYIHAYGTEQDAVLWVLAQATSRQASQIYQ